MTTGAIRRGLAAGCVACAAAASGYLVAAQTTAGAQPPALSSTGQSTCAVHKDPGGNAAASTAKRGDVEQLASELGVSVDRLGQATVALKQQGIAPNDPRAAADIAGNLGLNPGTVQRALDRMLAKFPFNRAYGISQRVADCNTASTPSADANDPKSVALRGLARRLGVSMPQLEAGFGATGARGVRTLDDPRMPAALANALGLDPSVVRSAVAELLSAPPFDRATDGHTATSTRK